MIRSILGQESFGQNIFWAEEFWPGGIFGQDNFWLGKSSVRMILSGADFSTDRSFEKYIFGPIDFR